MTDKDSNVVASGNLSVSGTAEVIVPLFVRYNSAQFARITNDLAPLTLTVAGTSISQPVSEASTGSLICNMAGNCNLLAPMPPDLSDL